MLVVTMWGTWERFALLTPLPLDGAIKRWCASDVYRSVWRSSRAAGRGWNGAYWLIGPGSAGLAQGCHCALPLHGRGHIVAASHI